MTTAFLRNFPAMVMGAALMLASSSSATTIYDNSVNDLVSRFNPGTKEVGDEIILAGTDRYITGFSFEFWGLNNGLTNAGPGFNVDARVRFYLNDGALTNGYAMPGTVFYDSGTFSIGSPTDRSTINFTTADFNLYPLGYMPVLSNFTWSVQFSGMDINDTVGVDIYDPPVIGGNHSDYWENNGGVWTLLTNSVAAQMNFAARFEATVPEPSVMTLAVLGGLSLLVIRRRLPGK